MELVTLVKRLVEGASQYHFHRIELFAVIAALVSPEIDCDSRLHLIFHAHQSKFLSEYLCTDSLIF